MITYFKSQKSYFKHLFPIFVKKATIVSFLISIIIILFSTSPDIFLDKQDDKNILLIVLMIFSTIFLLFLKKLYRPDLYFLYFLVSLIFTTIFNHPESLRLQTILYTILFGFTFVAYEHLLKQDLFSAKQYLNILKLLLVTYFIFLIIQQFCVLTGLPVILAGNYNIEDQFKLSSIAAEPSHLALNVTIIMYSYITIKELIIGRKYNILSDFKEDIFIWISFLWCIIFSNSATSLILLLIFIIKFVSINNFKFLIVGLTIISCILPLIDINTFERVSIFLNSLLTLDIQKIILSDHSASYRFVPAMMIFQKIDMSTLNGWFGYGIGYVSSFLHLEIPGTPEGYSTGGIMILWIEYGFIPFILFLIFSFSAIHIRKMVMPILFLFVFLFFGNGINTQLVWLSFLLMFTNKYFYLHSKNIYHKM